MQYGIRCKRKSTNHIITNNLSASYHKLGLVCADGNPHSLYFYYNLFFTNFKHAGITRIGIVVHGQFFQNSAAFYSYIGEYLLQILLRCTGQVPLIIHFY